MKNKCNYSRAKTLKIKTERGAGGVKTIILALILVAQILGIIYLSIYFTSIATWAVGFSFVFSLITCVGVLSSNKNASSKAVWIIFILVFFTFGYLFYIMSDERLFFRKSKKRYNAIYKKTNGYLTPKGVNIDNLAVKNDADFLFNAGNFPAYDSTALKYYSCGSDYFNDLIENIKNAQKFIFMEYFIVSDGVLLSCIIKELTDCVNRGVDVRIIYDDMGSHKTLSLKTKIALKKAGIKLVAFNRLIPVFSLALNVRDHRKIVVIDGKTAYTGGCNLADEYADKKRIYGYWKDSCVMVSGQAVDCFTITFLRQWEFLTRERQEYQNYLGLYEREQNTSVVIPYADGLDFDKHIAKGVYQNMIGSATEKIMIMTPYFIIDDCIMELLINKALSGVKITLIIAGVPDKKYAYGITRSNAEKLIDYGVEVFVMKNSFVHSKVVLTENAVVVGSINMDFRSFYQQFECAVYTNDKQFISSVEQDFEKTISLSALIGQNKKMRKNILYRIYAGFMQLFAPFM